MPGPAPGADAAAASAPGRRRDRSRDRSRWWLPASLLALGAIPVVIGSVRLVEVLGGPAGIPTDDRFTASPVPLVVHIVAAVGYTVFGAFQFSARLRRRHPGWHRRAGRLLVPLGLAVALSGLCMTLAYPRKEGTGDILWVTPPRGQLRHGGQHRPRPGRHPPP